MNTPQQFDESCITINNKKIPLPTGTYTTRNAEAILLVGHVLNSIIVCEETHLHELNIKEGDYHKILNVLENAESWLFPAINAMGELISSVDIEQLEDNTLSNAGYLVSTLTELVQTVQQTRKRLTTCVEIHRANVGCVQ